MHMLESDQEHARQRDQDEDHQGKPKDGHIRPFVVRLAFGQAQHREGVPGHGVKRDGLSCHLRCRRLGHHAVGKALI